MTKRLGAALRVLGMRKSLHISILGLSYSTTSHQTPEEKRAKRILPHQNPSIALSRERDLLGTFLSGYQK
jgi:hypothetical protein